MPPFVIILLLGLGGAITGSFINWAIYNLAYEPKLHISPWSPPGEKASKRRWIHYIPIIGWYYLRSDDSVHGKNHWIRPMAIELATMFGAIFFYQWQLGGGLIGGETMAPNTPFLNYEIWFSGHALLITMMLVATFIDFDEQTIPDWITVPGTLFALAYAAYWPEFRLPEVINLAAGIGQSWRPITFHSNSFIPFPTWHYDGRGLLFVLAILGIGTSSLFMPHPVALYKYFRLTLRMYRPAKALKVLFWLYIQPKRKTPCKIRVTNRKSILPTALTMSGIYILLIGFSIFLFMQPNLKLWDSYFGAVYGLGFGGGMVWAIRIVGGWAMGREAMGFGDVTLMAMIGAFLGWQAALLTFFLAPFSALFIAAAQLILTRRNDIAFGPYLCLSALGVILFWHPVWNWLKFSIFGWGPYLHYFLLGGLVAFGAMLAAIQFLKDRFLPEDEIESA